MTGSIKKITTNKVFATKGVSTIEVDIVLDDNRLGRAAAPGGTLRGNMNHSVDFAMPFPQGDGVLNREDERNDGK
jgi:enolase